MFWSRSDYGFNMYRFIKSIVTVSRLLSIYLLLMNYNIRWYIKSYIITSPNGFKILLSQILGHYRKETNSRPLPFAKFWNKSASWTRVWPSDGVCGCIFVINYPIYANLHTASPTFTHNCTNTHRPGKHVI